MQKMTVAQISSLFFFSFAARHPSVACVAAHPGVVRTKITRDFPTAVTAAYALADPITRLLFKSPKAGAHASVHAALAPSLSAGALKGRPAYVADSAEAAPGLPRDVAFLEDALWDASAAYAAARRR